MVFVDNLHTYLCSTELESLTQMLHAITKDVKLGTAVIAFYEFAPRREEALAHSS